MPSLLWCVVDTFEGLKHDNRVASNYHHSNLHLLSALTFFNRVVENEIQEDLVKSYWLNLHRCS